MFEGKLLQNIDEFKCRRCNACCEQPGYVYLKAGEAEAIAGVLGMELYAFTEQLTELIDRRRLVLKKKAGDVANPEACIFLTSDGCSIYPVRPAQCQDFPRGWRTERSLDYCAGLKELIKTGPYPRIT